ncbi:MAG: restriction endonuclease [Deltaproteobacteria bacterium]|nr:restriction endonuclease [Deltaproteobacteria bacterium]
MALWMVRGDKHGQYQALALEKGFAYNASQVSDLKEAKSREAIQIILRKHLPDANENRLKNLANQLYALAHRIKPGDLVAMPLRNRPQIAIGKVIGPYAYREDLGEIHHTVPVEWIEMDIPRTNFGQDLLYSFGAFMTVCQIQRNDAENRVRKVLEGLSDPGIDQPKTDSGKDASDQDEEGPSDVEQMARDQIMAHIEQRFKGHDLSRLVDSVLRAEGYIAQFSTPGPDGGVDILAGGGALGFQEPKLCVQVKSSQSPADVTILRSLQGTMQNFKANQGLLVSWGGFNKAVEKEARLSFFSVRLWDANDLIEAIFKNYDRLPEELQSELPLKRMWALVIEE